MIATDMEMPTDAVAAEARRALLQLAELVGEGGHYGVKLHARGAWKTVDTTVPHAAFQLLLDVLAQLGDGNAVTVVPVRAELTTQEAAELLNVSRPHVVHLMETGEMPFRKVGTHRRVRAADVLEYGRKGNARRREFASEPSEGQRE